MTIGVRNKLTVVVLAGYLALFIDDVVWRRAEYLGEGGVAVLTLPGHYKDGNGPNGADDVTRSVWDDFSRETLSPAAIEVTLTDADVGGLVFGIGGPP